MASAMIYARVSTVAQEDNYSLPTQIELCQQFCERKRYSIVGTYTDAHTGTESDRPGINALLDAIAVHRPDAIVILDVDRLGRATMVQSFLESELMRYGARIEFVNGGTISLDSDNPDELMVDIRKLFAKQENRWRVERSRRGKRGRVAAGQVLPTNGKAPFGYVYVSDRKHEGQFIIDEHEAATVRQIYDWLVRERVSSYEIAKRLHASGILTRGDTDAAVIKTSGNGSWSPTTVRKIIQNQIYKGEFVWGKFRHTKVNGKRRQIALPESEWLRIDVPPIVSAEVWTNAQTQLIENKANATRNTKREYLLRGMIFCTCGRRWTGRYKTNVNRAYYRCGANEAETWRSNCDAKFSYHVDKLDAAVWSKITDHLLNPETMMESVRRKQSEAAGDSEKRDRQLEAARKELAGIEKKLAALLDTTLSGDYPKSVLDSKRTELLARHIEYRDAITRLEAEQETIGITDNTESMLLSLASDARLALPHLSFAQKRRVLELLRVRIEVKYKNSVMLHGIFTEGIFVNLLRDGTRLDTLPASRSHNMPDLSFAEELAII